MVVWASRLLQANMPLEYNAGEYERPDYVHDKGGGHVFSLLVQFVIAVIYKQTVVNKLGRMDEAIARSSGQAGGSDFKYGIFDCCGNAEYCLYALCCPLARLGHTYHAAGVMEYWPAVFLVCLMTTVVPCVTCCFLASLRSQLKRKFGITESPFLDCLCWMWCSCCLVNQEARAVDDVMWVKVGCCFDVRQQAGAFDALSGGGDQAYFHPAPSAPPRDF